MDIRAAEISAILKEQIADFGTEAEVTEVGRVLSVGDGIARVYGLDQVQAGATALDVGAIVALIGWFIIELVVIAIVRIFRPAATA